jgi:hypothetical protein
MPVAHTTRAGSGSDSELETDPTATRRRAPRVPHMMQPRGVEVIDGLAGVGYLAPCW